MGEPVIRFERTFDYGLVRSVLTHPKLYPHLSDDNSPPAGEFQPVTHPAIWYITPYSYDELLGLWMFVPQTSICWDVHTALLPHAWGSRGLQAARLLPDWMWANTPCRRIVTSVPSSNRLALHFAVKAGMKIWGVNRESYLKGGILGDQVCLGISKPGLNSDVEEVFRYEAKEELCQQQPSHLL